MKKLISIVLALSMLISLVPTFAFATEAENTTSYIITLFDFGDTAALSNVTYSKIAATPSALAYEGKESSLKWEMKLPESLKLEDTTPELDMLTDFETDLSLLSEDALVNVRFYTEDAGSTFNLVYMGSEKDNVVKDTDNDGEADAKTFKRYGVVANGGWQVHSTPLKPILENLYNYGTNDYKFGVRFNDEGWSNMTNGLYNDGDTIYIDQIWVDTNPDAYYDNLGEDAKVLWKATDDSVNLKISNDTERNFYTEYTLKSNNYVFTTLSDTEIFSDSDYQYINMWIYSKQAQQDGMYFTLFIDTSTVIRYPIPQIDWSGWKLISFNLADDRESDDESKHGIVKNLRFDVGKWANLSSINMAPGNVTFGLDGVWLSNTSAQAEWENANTFGNVSAIEGSIFSRDFNTNGGISSYSTDIGSLQTTRSFNAKINRYNAHTYDTNARLGFSSVTYNNVRDYSGFLAVGRVGTLQIRDRIAKNSNSTQVDSNSYINAWIYTPEERYTFDGTTPAEILMAVGHRGANNAGNVSYKYVAIPVNWTGWKLISIPVSYINTDLTEYGIAHIYLSCNLEKLPRDASGNVLIVERSEADYERGYVLNGSYHNVFSRKYSTISQTDGVISSVSSEVHADYYNYIDVERVWISDGPVTDTEPDLLPADNSELKCSSDGKAVNIFTSNDAIAKTNINVIKTVGNTVSKVNASYSNGTVTLPEFTYGATYSVYADVCGANGVYNKDEFTFTTEDIHVGDKLISDDGKTATITFHGNLGEYEDSLLVAAVYSGSNKQELEAAIPGTVAVNGVATVTIPENIDTEGKTVEFFFFDSLDNIKPLKFNFQK